MDNHINNLIKLSLALHKMLLDLEKESYESKNGAISSNNEYFGLVVNHEDFKWLRPLSEIIAALDEESERSALNFKEINKLLRNLDDLLRTDSKSEFSLRYRGRLEKNEKLSLQDVQLKAEIAKIINKE